MRHEPTISGPGADRAARIEEERENYRIVRAALAELYADVPRVDLDAGGALLDTRARPRGGPVRIVR